MKVDLPKYLETHSSVSANFKTVNDIVNFNKQDSLLRIPYGQALFEGIVAETISENDFEQLKIKFNKEMFEKVKTECEVLINGIVFDLRTPLLFLYFNFSYLDGFLYIIIN